MLRVLTLSTLFPNAAHPALGVFVERQTLGIAARPDVELEVVAPVGLPVWPLSLHPHYAPLRRLPRQESWKGLVVHRPRYRVWPRIGAHRTAKAMAEALLPMLRDLRARFPFDVMDAEYFWPDGPAAMRLSEALGLPFSVKARGSDIHLWGQMRGIGGQILVAGGKAAGLLAVSGPLRDDMVALGLPGGKIRVHHTGIDLDLFHPVDRAAAKAALGLSGPLLVCAGHLIPRKGQDVALEALALLPAATLLVIGEGPDAAALRRLAQRLGVADRVRFLGPRPHGELPALLAAADVAVQPSHAEGLANVWVEALACGTPVVTCDVGGARDAIDRPEAGRLVPRDPGAFAAAVQSLLDAPPPAEAVRRAAEKFSWARNTEELFAHLSAIANAR
jgi:glycosyltransferase involved in cell wall biosynthesis